ncbi:MAG: hypothetical protein M0026_19885 [Nocardiopsaceae bacterium]|nr:hypothetical protein [Nocardiopsaceae bacterium]
MWFVGPGRSRGGADAESVAAQLRRTECEIGEHEAALTIFKHAHRELDQRVRRMEEDLETLRRERLEAYVRWWNEREDRDRARHVARRLRRRLHRVRRRIRPMGGYAEG